MRVFALCTVHVRFVTTLRATRSSFGLYASELTFIVTRPGLSGPAHCLRETVTRA